MEFTREVVEALGAAFPEDEIEFLPRATSGGMALGLPYIDARSVMRRLDAVVGPANWSFDFDVLSPDGKMVKGRLTVLGVTKCDAGEAGAEDEPLKSAISDALKRAGVHFGIGRYLYYLPRLWAPFDPQKRRFIEPPRLDPEAVRKALGVCGITTVPDLRNGRPARPEPSRAPANRVAESSAGSRGPERRAPQGTETASEREAAAARKSIWTAGAAPEESGAPAGRASSPAPESAGDRAAMRSDARPAAAEAPRPRVEAPAGAMVCSGSGCGKALTKGQHDVSVRAFGQPLCPACQKQHAKSGS